MSRAEQKANILEAQLSALEAKLDAFMAEYGIEDDVEEKQGGEKKGEATTATPVTNGEKKDEIEVEK